MKTTLDLPPELVKQLKLRAVHEGRKLKDSVADVLRAGLKAKSNGTPTHKTVIRKDKRTGLPVIQCQHPAPQGQEMTAERIAEVLSEQEAEWYR